MRSGAPQVTKVNLTTLAGKEDFETIISLEGLAISPILDSGTEADVDGPRELCYNLEWDPILQAQPLIILYTFAWPIRDPAKAPDMADGVFRGSCFGDGIRRATRGQGALDVVLNSLTRDGLCESWKCLNKFGRFIDVGNPEGPRSRIEVDRPDSKESFLSLNMPTLIDERPQLVKRLLVDTTQILEHKKTRPATPITKFPISQVQDALRAQQAGKTPGKLVVLSQTQRTSSR
ncbi:hypothetical protein L209DRAFT_293698 [Thermothelomyces heterothallicus CBS 203.75]